MADGSTTSPTPGAQVVNGVKLVADVGILPGIGQLAEGKITEGALYGLGGIAAKVLLGPIGWLGFIAVGLDSYSKSTTGNHLWEHKAPTTKTKTTA